MLNKLRCHAMPLSNFQPIKLLDPDCWYKFTYWMANSLRSQLIWIYTVCKGRVYLGSAGQGLKIMGLIILEVVDLFKTTGNMPPVLVKGSLIWDWGPGTPIYKLREISRCWVNSLPFGVHPARAAHFHISRI